MVVWCNMVVKMGLVFVVKTGLVLDWSIKGRLRLPALK